MQCPGQDSRYWKPEAIFETKCPKCGNEVEFFKDDTTRTCKQCGHRFLNPGLDFGCASYCQYAEQCIGNLPPELIAQKEGLLKDRVAIEVKRYFGRDFKRIGHAARVARHAEQIGREEEANLAVVLTAAYLHDIGIREAEKLYQSSAARYQEELGPPAAREILTKLGAAEKLIDEVCDIVGHHHHPRAEETINFKCLYDADRIVNLEEARDNTRERAREKAGEGAGEERAFREESFLTETGRRVARKVLAA